jgi:hypothetical protein
MASIPDRLDRARRPAGPRGQVAFAEPERPLVGLVAANGGWLARVASGYQVSRIGRHGPAVRREPGDGHLPGRPGPAPGSAWSACTPPTAAVRPGLRHVPGWAQAPRVPACAAGTAGDAVQATPLPAWVVRTTGDPVLRLGRRSACWWRLLNERHLQPPRCPSRHRDGGGTAWTSGNRALNMSFAVSEAAVLTITTACTGICEPVLPHAAPTAAVRPRRRPQAPHVPACATGTAGNPAQATCHAGQYAGTPRFGQRHLSGRDVQADTVIVGEWHGTGLDIENLAASGAARSVCPSRSPRAGWRPPTWAAGRTSGSQVAISARRRWPQLSRTAYDVECGSVALPVVPAGGAPIIIRPLSSGRRRHAHEQVIGCQKGQS